MSAHKTERPESTPVPLEAFRRWRLMQGWKWLLTGAAVVLAVAWWASRYTTSEVHARGISPGPLVAVHGLWEAKCDACHEPFTPVDSGDWLAALRGPARPGVWAGDGRCKTCHAGPLHHDAQRAESVESCGGCHRDHFGRDVPLSRIPDGHCNTCHHDLKNHHQHGEQNYQDVTDFAKDHPDFRVLRDKEGDKSKLSFSHWRHMLPGMAAPDARNPWTLDKISAGPERERYRRDGQADADPVQLGCGSCHQLDAADFHVGAAQLAGLPASALLPPRASGASMQPITYDNQCKVCHPLTFDDASPGLSAPHRLQPAEIDLFLRRVYTDRYLESMPVFAAGAAGLLAGPPSGPWDAVAALPPARSLLFDYPKWRDSPGADRSRPDHPASWEAITHRQEILEQVARAERRLYESKQACGECHQWEQPKDKDFPLKILPTAVPSVWLSHAKFDHVAHRAVDCRQCHARAYSDDPEASRENADVLIAEGPPGPDGRRPSGIQLCRQCHGPAASRDGAAAGGARFDCVECHTYHNGGRPLQGLGAAARDPDPEVKTGEDVRRFLTGAPP